MRKEIEEIYRKNLVLYREAESAVYFFHIQNQDIALRKTVNILNRLMEVFPLYLQESSYFNSDRARYSEGSLLNICQLLLEAQEQKDYVLIADYYELYLLPLLSDLQEKIGLEEGNPVEEENYQLEYTSSGALTLRVERAGRTRYLHSNKSPYREALELALSWEQEDKTEYIIYGLGLGYHVQALAELDSNIFIQVYESDKRILELCKRYGVFAELQKNPKVKISYESDLNKVLEKAAFMGKDCQLLIHEPSLSMLEASPAKEWLEEYFINYSSIKNQGKILDGNFRENTKGNVVSIDVWKPDFADKTVYLVGAGPSLDINFTELEKLPENSLILSTGTAFRKLIRAGIRPDFVIEADANERIVWHFNNIEKENVPMFLLSTAAHKLKQSYAGKKYLIFQKDYPKAEEYAKEHGLTLYETGGSVMTTALDIAIRMGCKKIVFLGLDLAYTGNYAHAAGTSRREIPEGSTDLRMVEAIGGEMLYTSRSLTMYRKWIERRIARERASDIAFIDASEGGARIKGTQIKTLKEVIADEKNTCHHTGQEWL